MFHFETAHNFNVGLRGSTVANCAGECGQLEGVNAETHRGAENGLKTRMLFLRCFPYREHQQIVHIFF